MSKCMTYEKSAIYKKGSNANYLTLQTHYAGENDGAIKKSYKN